MIQPKTNSIQAVKAPLKNYTKPFLAKKAGKIGNLQNSSSGSNLKKSVEQYYTQPKKSKEVGKKSQTVSQE